MIQKDHETAKLLLPSRGQGTVFVRPRSRMISLGRMRILFLILVVLAPGRTEARVRWQHETELFDGVSFRHWPVWARPGNDNILSRVKIFGQNHA